MCFYYQLSELNSCIVCTVQPCKELDVDINGISYLYAGNRNVRVSSIFNFYENRNQVRAYLIVVE